jgi:AcrR family transcriptional regulator
MPRKVQAGKALEIRHRRTRVAELYELGRTMMQIAAEVGVTVGTVSRDVKAIHQEFLDRAVGRREEMLARELVRIDWVERQAIKAWFKSMEDDEIELARQDDTDTADGKRVRQVAQHTSKRRDGNPKFLERVGWCVEQRMKAFGLYAPEKLLHANHRGDGPPELRITHTDRELEGFYETLTDEQLELLESLNERLAEYRGSAGAVIEGSCASTDKATLPQIAG